MPKSIRCCRKARSYGEVLLVVVVFAVLFLDGEDDGRRFLVTLDWFELILRSRVGSRMRYCEREWLAGEEKGICYLHTPLRSDRSGPPYLAKRRMVLWRLWGQGPRGGDAHRGRCGFLRFSSSRAARSRGMVDKRFQNAGGRREGCLGFLEGGSVISRPGGTGSGSRRRLRGFGGRSVMWTTWRRKKTFARVSWGTSGLFKPRQL